VHYADEVDSTDDLALALAARGRPEGTSVIAEMQRRGRGRRGREWFSPPGAGLYLSVIVTPQVPDASAALVTLAAGAATAQAVQRTSGLPVELKWPNDVVVGRPWRKLGGILTEASTRGGRVEAIVVGIGLNLLGASYPAELAGVATSIETELGRSVPRPELLVALLEELQQMVRALDGEPDSVLGAWRRFGRRAVDRAPVRWMTPSGLCRGVTRGIDRDGALVVEVEGRLERIASGEVVWEDLWRD
jgi:BirA family biotin operon repressor/biotin-[acetyl-CoA-carboxylase] ligase